jgi:type I pantothenate kinase
LIGRWYVERFKTLRETAFKDPRSYFHRLAGLDDEEAEMMATTIWNRINLPNLRENILPTRPRADLVLRKGASHRVEQVALRRL